MDPNNKPIEKANQPDLGVNTHPNTAEGNYNYSISIPPSAPQADAALKLPNSVLMNLNNQSHLNFMRNSQDQNYSDVSLYQGVQAITAPQNYLFKNQPPNPHVQNEQSLTMPNTTYDMRMPTAQMISDPAPNPKATSPHPSQSPQLPIPHQQNQGARTSFTVQQGFQMNPTISNNASFQQHGQMMQAQMMQMTHNQVQPGNPSQNYMSQINSAVEQQSIRSGSTPRAPTPLNISSQSAQDVGNAHPLPFIVQAPNQNNNIMFQLKNEQTHDVNSPGHMPNPQLSNQISNQISSNNSTTPVNMVPHIIQPQNNIQYEHMNFQSKISLVVNQITQIQANLSSLTNLNNPQAAQIYQFLTNRLQQFRTLYCQLVMQQQQQAQQQQQMQRSFIPMVQGGISGQMSNNPVSISMYQQQLSAQNQIPQNIQLNPILPRANLIQSPYQIRMNQSMQSQPMMMPPGLARFQGPRPPFMNQGQNFMMQPGHMRTSFQMDSGRGRRGYRGTRRRRKFSSESEEEDELTSSDNESTSQMTPSGVSAEDMELRRSSRRQTQKSYMQDYPDDSDGEKNKKDNESISGKTQDLIPFQPTEQIEGKLMLVEKILSDRVRSIEEGDDVSMSIDGEVIEEFYVKFKFFSYLHCEWCTPGDLKKRDRNALSKIKRYKIRKRDSPFLYLDEDPFNPDYTEIDRIFDVKTTKDPSNPEQQITCYLIKWCALPYDESTWEFEDVVDEASVQQFYQRNTFPSQELLTYKQKPNTYQWQKIQQSPLYKNENVLRDYQLEGINWLIYEYYVGTNCILADEMGLGKTIQSIAFLIEVRRLGIRGPFLIIAPLSTIGNWYREFRSWSDFNVVVFHGAASSRNIIHRYELYYRNENGDIIPDVCKFEVLVTTYEMILSENKFLSSIRWRVAIVDEAHRLKNRKCKLLGNLSNIYIEHRVLLTGTPLQNTLDELLSLLNFLDPSRADALESVIQQNSGRLESNIQVQQIQAFLKPVILRRLKEDVEKNIAPKEETIIEVEMTSIQKKVYRGILERNLTFLIKGTSSTNLPSLMNVMMELRKCCNHPFLNNGVEEKIFAEYSSANPELDRQTIFRKALVESSGKLVLVDKLLPKLRDSGHKMLIFSQMVRVLDLIEEYLVANNFLFERIDGSVRGNLRQAAIDRFSKPDSDRSVFLLCTKAGGLGINLTAADTVIIFDSDWNPQNDIQAQARCHRIGQNKTVKVYRLICRKTYEREMFDRASLKLGLDKAVLHDMNTSNMDSQGQFAPTRAQLTKKEVEKLIREGAYANIMDEDTEASAQFCSEDIDQILERRATVIRIAGEAKGSTFAKASFNAEISGEQVDIDDPDFWAKWAKSAKVNVENDKDFIGDQPRIRKQVRSFGGDSDVEFSELVQEHGAGRRAAAPQSLRNSWLKKECLRVEKYLLIYGWRRWPDILKFGNFKSNMTIHDVEQISKTILVICWQIVKTTDTSFTDFVEKAIRLTTLRHRHDEFDTEDINYRPYGKRTRNRKSRDNRKKSEKLKLCLVQTTSDWKNLDVDALVFDQNYKKHLQHCASKILIRLRLLFYIEYYILRDCKEDVLLGVHVEDIIVPIVSTSQNTLTLPSWWDSVCDKSLIVGTFKYGYEKYDLMTSDKQLCYSKHIGLESKSSSESNEAVVKRRGRKKKILAPLLSDDDNAIETELFNDQDKVADIQSFDTGKLNDMPSHSDLNTYVKRLVMSYWKNRSKTHGKSDGRIVDIKSKWTRKEEADFYRALTTYGIERDLNDIIIWENFRKIGKFDRKDDQLLSLYLENLINRSNTIISSHAKTILNGNNGGPSTITDGYLTQEKAEKIIQRIELFDLIRKAILIPQFSDILKLAPSCIELPDWWNSESDLDLLTLSSLFGIDQNDKRIFVEEGFSFHKVVKSFHEIFLASHEFVAGISDVANPKELSIEMIKSIIHWPKIKIIINRLYGLSMLAIHSTWCDKYQSESSNRPITTKSPIVSSHLSPSKPTTNTPSLLVHETMLDTSSYIYNSEFSKQTNYNPEEQVKIEENKVE